MSNKLEVGKTYKSKNGHVWECIAVKNDIAWLAGVFESEYGAAYKFHIDGTPICLATENQIYRIEFEPVRTQYYEEVYINGGGHGRLCYETVDGVFDPKSIRVEFDVVT